MMKALWASVMANPVLMRRLNGWLAIIWFVAAFPICIYLSTSLPFLVFVSVYAVVTGHWSTWQAARVEVRQEQIADAQGVEDPSRDQEIADEAR